MISNNYEIVGTQKIPAADVAWIFQRGLEQAHARPAPEAMRGICCASDELLQPEGCVAAKFNNSKISFHSLHWQPTYGNFGALYLEIGKQNKNILGLIQLLPWARIMGGLFASLVDRLAVARIDPVEQERYRSSMLEISELLTKCQGCLLPREPGVV